MSYAPTLWINRLTTLGPTNLNKLENGLKAVGDAADTGIANAATAQATAAAAQTTANAAIPATQKAAANGVASLDANGRIPAAQRISYGTTPPASPNDGDEWILPADATNGVMWRFRYNAASASAYKWEFVGGSPVLRDIQTQETLAGAANAWIDAPTVGPQFQVARAGDYYATICCAFNNSTAGIVFISGIAINATDANPYNMLAQAPAGYWVAVSVGGRITAAANDYIRQRYFQGASGSLVQKRDLALWPVRVS